MSFLAPWFWIGAAAIALPVIFHLVRQRIRRRQEFSSLMFLRPTPPKVKRRTRLEHLLLLALRCLILMLLAAAFARPFFKRPPDAADREESGEIVAVLIDTSASMQRGALWNDALEITSKLAAELRSARQVSLLGFDRQLSTLVSFDDWARADASQRQSLWRERLSTAKITPAGTHLGKALVTAAELIEDARSREQASADTRPARIIVVSDAQEGSHLEGLAGFNWPARLAVELRSPKPVTTSNAGLHPVARDETATLSFSATNEVRVFVSNASDASKELLSLAWRDPAGVATSNAQQVYLPAGQSRVVRLAATTNAATANRIQLLGDEEPFDNEIHLVPEEPEQLSVAVMGADDESHPGSLTFFLRRVFQSTARQQIQFLAVTNPVAGVPAGAALDFMVATDAEGVAPILKKHLDAGGTALLALNREGSAETLRQIMGLASLAAAEGQTREYALLGRIEFGHPLFAPFLDMRFSDFSRIHFWKYRKLDATALPETKVLAAFDSGDPAIIETRVGRGTLFVLTSSWRQTDSQLALSSKFVPLLYSMLELNRPARPSTQDRIVGDSLTLAGFARPGVLTLPDGTSSNLVASAAEITFASAGIHRLKFADGKELAVAVNLDPAESRTGPLKEEELIRIGVPMNVDPKNVSRTLAARLEQQKDSETESQQKNWRWLLAIAAGIFLVESWLSGRVGRADAAPAQS